MITGFNTDVVQDGQVYHVQTEDRGREHPILESLVYIGGTIVAKKLTPYDEQLKQGASEEMIASLLKRQHQVIIAAIKAGRIEDLIRHSAKEQGKEKQPQQNQPQGKKPRNSAALPHTPPQRKSQTQQLVSSPLKTAPPDHKQIDDLKRIEPLPAPPAPPPKINPSAERAHTARGGLDLDEVISDYMKRSSEQARLDLKVITPEVFTAGKSVSLRVQVSYGLKPEIDAIVTIKIIGTAFKPQVYIGRAGRDGLASFTFTLPAFTAGTAAIVIEAQSNHGRGELKHLIRRA